MCRVHLSGFRRAIMARGEERQCASATVLATTRRLVLPRPRHTAWDTQRPHTAPRHNSGPLRTFFLAGSVTPATMRLSSLRIVLAAIPVVADLKSWDGCQRVPVGCRGQEGVMSLLLPS